jgi:hypothetical protein
MLTVVCIVLVGLATIIGSSSVDSTRTVDTTSTLPAYFDDYAHPGDSASNIRSLNTAPAEPHRNSYLRPATRALSDASTSTADSQRQSSHPRELAAGATTLTIERVNATYDAVLPCLKKRWNAANIQELHNFSYPWPYEEAEKHYQEILRVTEKYRHTPMHSYAEYSGPWIENHFITAFIDKPLSYFNGLIPLFVQWIDNHLLNKLKEIEAELNKILRKDIIYFAVSQGDNGLELITYGFPNLLIFSSGGFGHVILPLIKGIFYWRTASILLNDIYNVLISQGELSWRPPPASYDQTVGFFGNVNAYRSRRAELLNYVKASCEKHGVSIKLDRGTRSMCVLCR